MDKDQMKDVIAEALAKRFTVLDSVFISLVALSLVSGQIMTAVLVAVTGAVVSNLVDKVKGR